MVLQLTLSCAVREWFADATTEEEQIAIYEREADDTCRRLRDKALQLVWLFKRREPSTQLEIDNCIYDRDHCNWKLGQLQRRRDAAISKPYRGPWDWVGGPRTPRWS